MRLDLKNDAHLVKQFTTKSIDVLCKNKVSIRKIIEVTDQAPSQYKNKTVFRYMSQSKIPIMKNFFGVCHGKSSCDACTGRVKQGVSRLVCSGTETVNSAKTFYTACVDHLVKPPKMNSNECQHYMLTFELHTKLSYRPKTTTWPAVPDTHKIHSSGNVNIPNDIYLRSYSCCCVGCLHGRKSAQILCVEMTGRATTLKQTSLENQISIFGLQIENTDILCIASISWVQHINRMSLFQSFSDIEEYVRSKPLPAFLGQPHYNMTNAEMDNLDLVALHHIPSDAP